MWYITAEHRGLLDVFSSERRKTKVLITCPAMIDAIFVYAKITGMGEFEAVVLSSKTPDKDVAFIWDEMNSDTFILTYL